MSPCIHSELAICLMRNYFSTTEESTQKLLDISKEENKKKIKGEEITYLSPPLKDKMICLLLAHKKYQVPSFWLLSTNSGSKKCQKFKSRQTEQKHFKKKGVQQDNSCLELQRNLKTLKYKYFSDVHLMLDVSTFAIESYRCLQRNT